ncbi:MAG: 2'-deoxycytidine 5'-triphosphate deaminase [Deltaproteobacteria bacterium]|nr:2'-deoxycytidine 5'-triphosphate deaminase [Deltaproteobacteria bacterium]
MTNAGKSGVFSFQELQTAIKDNVITSEVPIEGEQVQPASLDLRLGGKAYALVSSFLPNQNQTIEDIIHVEDSYGADLVKYVVDISQGGVLDKGIIYLIPLMEGLNLPDGVDGKTNPKSTTGRLDIFSRVLSDKNPRFDHIKEGYKGQLYLEVMPRTFAVKLKQGQSLAQLRLRRGDSYIGDEELKNIYLDKKLLYTDTAVLPIDEAVISHGLFMSVDLKGVNGIVGYKAKKNSQVVDLTKRDFYKITDFWEPIEANKKGTLTLEEEEFYILGSKEKIRIPNGYAADMAPFEAGSGELRTHYAGFFDPGFGYGNNGELSGTKAVLEVRAHDVPFMITDGQRFCKLYFEKMSEEPERLYGTEIGSSYQFQGITLSKQFQKVVEKK